MELRIVRPLDHMEKALRILLVEDKNPFHERSLSYSSFVSLLKEKIIDFI